MAEKESGSEDPKKKKGKVSDALDKIKGDEQVKRGINWFWENRFLLFAAALMILGIIFSFYYIHIGGLLVGLALGISFFEEIQGYFIQLRDFYSTQGLFKTVMVIGAALYFLIAIPVFIIALAVGFAAIFILNWLSKK